MRCRGSPQLVERGGDGLRGVAAEADDCSLPHAKDCTLTPSPCSLSLFLALVASPRLAPHPQSVNYNHLLPTRYALELEGLKGVVAPETFKEPSSREDAKKQVKKLFEERYLQGKNRWFFSAVRPALSLFATADLSDLEEPVADLAPLLLLRAHSSASKRITLRFRNRRVRGEVGRRDDDDGATEPGGRLFLLVPWLC